MTVAPTVNVSLGIQAYGEYLLWGLNYINITCFGLFGSLGYGPTADSKKLEYGLRVVRAGVPSFFCFRIIFQLDGFYCKQLPTFF